MSKLLMSFFVAVSLPAQSVDFAFYPDFAKNGIILIPYDSSSTFTTDAELAFGGQYPQASDQDVGLLRAILPYSFLLQNYSGHTINVYIARWSITDTAGRTRLQRYGWQYPYDLGIFENGLTMGPDAINFSSFLQAAFGAAKEVGTEVVLLWRTTSRKEPVTEYLAQVVKDGPSLRTLDTAQKMSHEGAYDGYLRFEKGRLARSWLALADNDFDRLLQGARRDAALEIPVLRR